MNKDNEHHFTRGDFLNLSGLGIGAWTFFPRLKHLGDDFPDSERLGRICTEIRRGRVNLRKRPDYNSASAGILYEDDVVVWLREVIGSRNSRPYRNNQRWVETPEGYIWSANVQPVSDERNEPVEKFLVRGENPGMWVEVTVPYVEAILANPPARHFWVQYRIQNQIPIRFYYKQILWVDEIKEDDDGIVWYRINERFGSEGDLFWSPAEAFRPIQEEEVSPIHPDVEDKQIVVNIHEKKQYLSCFEGGTEVYFCRISSGRGKNSTPATQYGHPFWRKAISYHMGGSTDDGIGWDTPGIGWTALFHGEGAAIHSTFWHNNFGERMSHGCVNVRPEDAKWIFRWSNPPVEYKEGKFDNDQRSNSTLVKVINE